MIKLRRLTILTLLAGLTLLAACSSADAPDPLLLEDDVLTATPPAPLSSAQAENSASFVLENTGSQTLAWAIAVSNDSSNPKSGNWFSLAPAQGELASGEAVMVILTLESGLPTGIYKARLSVRYEGGVTEFEVLGSVEGGGGSAQIVGTVTTANTLISLDAAGTSKGSVAAPPAATRESFVPGQLLIKYDESYRDDLLSLQTLSGKAARLAALTEGVKSSYGLRTLASGAQGPALVEAAGQDVLKLAQVLNADPRILYAEPNYYLHTAELPNDPNLGQQWALAAAGLPVAWNAAGGAAVTVAVIDSGFDLNHPDLADRWLPGLDLCPANSGACPEAQIDVDPGYGNSFNRHGTHVAGIIGALSNNGEGVVGVVGEANVSLLPVKIFNDSGSGATTATFVQGIRWAAGLPTEVGGERFTNPNPADVINMSLGGFFDSRSVQDAVNDARAAGALLLAASGNSGLDRIMSPAAADGVLAVGSVNADFRRSCFSNYGSNAAYGPGKLDVVTAGGEGAALGNDLSLAGPGCNPPVEALLSTLPSGGYGLDAGTSMATPLASGIAALILSQTPDLSVEQLEQRFLNSTYYDPVYMTEAEYGAGILRAEFALGLPGPGDSVSVSASGPADSAVATVTLNLKGGSDSFTLDALSPGSYTVEARAEGSKTALEASAEVRLVGGDALPLNLQLATD